MNGNKVNKAAYILLALFLGGVGAHKFYAGKIGSGLLYLVFSLTFIPAIIALFEALNALGKRADEFGRITV